MDITNTIRDICHAIKTPFYLYDENAIVKKINALKRCFTNNNYQLLYAMKANSNPSLIKTITAQNLGIDACSVEEAEIARLCGVPSSAIYLNVDCITDDEMDYAILNNVNLIVGSFDALTYLASRYRAISLGIRVNTSVAGGQPAKVLNNGQLSKFGIDINQLDEAIAFCENAALNIVGIHSHTGSGELKPESHIKNAVVLAEASKKIAGLKYINFGGGFGFDYVNHTAFSINAIHNALKNIRDVFNIDKNIVFILEPGRYLVADAGALIGKVCSVKTTHERNYIGLNTGYNHFPRCFYYEAWHEIINLSSKETRTDIYDVVGNLCQSGDVFARQRVIEKTKTGDLLCINDVGAYGFSLSSNFNSRIRPAEYLLTLNGDVKMIRRAEKIEDLLSTCIME